MRFSIAALLLCALAAIPASAQNENITVTGKSEPQTREQVIEGFVKSYTSPSRMLKKIARWAEPVCPATIGLGGEVDGFVSARIRETAQKIGAPSGSETRPCRINVLVVFAREPQALLDDIRLHHVGMLGDVDSPSHAKKLATFTHAAQAWYGTNIMDQWGGIFPSEPCWPSPCYMVGNVSRLSDGLRSVFYSVLVVVDVNKANGFETGAVADYVAMLALSQTNAFDSCLGLPSIANLLTPECDASLKSPRLSEADLAYLTGLYKADPGEKGNLQQGDIAASIGKRQAGR